MISVREETNRDEGFTLIELIVASMLMLIVLAGVGALMVVLMTTPNSVTARESAAGSAQTAANSISSGIRNSSDFRLTNPIGNDQLLVARVAQAGNPIVWSCAAWYYDSTGNRILYTTSMTLIPSAPTSTDLASWHVLDTSVTPTSGTSIFSSTGAEVDLSFSGAANSTSAPQLITTSAISRAGSTGSPQCY